ncbi:hypothetical protein CPB86DRAFT_803051 [Serendipita vermifera]|nr:hypothetical protein CPB86DRAFT_803051 [Serendipita vermifera]
MDILDRPACYEHSNPKSPQQSHYPAPYPVLGPNITSREFCLTENAVNQIFTGKQIRGDERKIMWYNTKSMTLLGPYRYQMPFRKGPHFSVEYEQVFILLLVGDPCPNNLHSKMGATGSEGTVIEKDLIKKVGKWIGRPRHIDRNLHIPLIGYGTTLLTSWVLWENTLVTIIPVTRLTIGQGVQVA